MASASSPLLWDAPSGSPERAGATIATPLESDQSQKRRGLREAPRGSEWRRDLSAAGAPAPAIAGQSPALDTLAQLDQSLAVRPIAVAIAQSGQTPEQTLLKRARAKYLSLPLAVALAELARSKRVSAEVAGDFALAELHHRFEKSYRNTVYCASQLVQKGEKLEGRYCSNRWCLVCARVKTGRAINRYRSTLESWDRVKSPPPNVPSRCSPTRCSRRWFVTLTAPNVAGPQLAQELRRYLADVVAIARSMKRSHRVQLVALRKLECTYNEQRDDYHPHFHFIVRDEAAARLLLSLWLERRPDARAIAQDVRPATAGDVVEFFKYFTKIVTRVAGNPRARGSVRVAQAEKLDVIFAAMRGLRVFQPTGFTLPKQIDEELPVGEDGHTRAPDHTRGRMGDFPSVAHWEWSQPSSDWFNLATGEALAEYNPSPVMRELVAGVESQRADPRLRASAEPIHQSTHANAVRNALVARQRVPPREKIFSPRTSRAPTHQSTHANANEKSARKFGERNFGDGIDDRFR